MNLKQLLNTREKCREQMLNALEEFVRENGEEMSDYYRNEHGIDEDYYGYDVVKILDTAEFGCYFPLALQLNDDSFENATEIDELEDWIPCILVVLHRKRSKNWRGISHVLQVL